LDWKNWINKKVFIETEGSKYFGTVVEVTDSGNGLIWIGFYCSNNNRFVLLKIDEIKKIEELP